MHERSSRSAPSRLHQFCTSRQQLPPTTWHAGGQLSRRPLRWLAEEQSRLLNRRLRASAIGPDHLLASGTKDQAVGPLSRARRGTRLACARSKRGDAILFFFRLGSVQKKTKKNPRLEVTVVTWGSIFFLNLPSTAHTPQPTTHTKTPLGTFVEKWRLHPALALYM